MFPASSSWSSSSSSSSSSETFALYLFLCLTWHLLADGKNPGSSGSSGSGSTANHPQIGLLKSDLLQNCTMKPSMCSKDLNLICDPYHGQCTCHNDTPVRLSEEIPCIKHKLLGELCIHNSECDSIEHSVCVATFLFSMKMLTKTPTYKQWFFYNKIHNDEDMNYLLNKLYGRCRCRKGFRAINSTECRMSGIRTMFPCHQDDDDCRQYNARCEANRCVCHNGHHFDPNKGYCDEIIKLHGQFCAASSDCYSQYSSGMECRNSICVCSRNHFYHNQTGCIRRDICSEDGPGATWNQTTNSCQPDRSSFNTVTFCNIIIKSFPLFLIIIIVFNLICYVRGRRIADRQRELARRSDDFDGTFVDTPSTSPSTSLTNPHRTRINRNNNRNNHNHCIQLCSLLSLPDYETVLSGTLSAERLPTYEEALKSLKCGGQRNRRSGSGSGSYQDDQDDHVGDNLLQQPKENG